MWWKRKHQDFRAEIEAHIKLERDELEAEGLPPSEAQASAHRAFGNATIAEEHFYESGRWMLADHVLRDLRFAIRLLLKDLRFTTLAVIGLTLGLGVSTAIFALLSSAFQQSEAAGLQDPASLVGLNRLENGHPNVAFSYPEYLSYRDRATAFRAVTAESFPERFIVAVSGNGGAEPEEVRGRFESANFLSAIGRQPALGRGFSAEEEKQGGPVAILDFHFWQRRFGGSRETLGKSVLVNGHRLTIIGVADSRFGFGDSSVYLPLALQPVLSNRGNWLPDSPERWLMLTAFLRPGVTVQRAQAEVNAISRPVNRGTRTSAADGAVRVSPGGPNPEKRRASAAAVFAIVVAVSMILLIACSNLANLLLARAVVRRREIAVRLSLGASRGRLVGQLLTESMLLAMVGGIVGMLFSGWLVKALMAALPSTPGMEVRLDFGVVLYGFALSLATGLAFGLAPALAATKTNLSQAVHCEGLAGSIPPRAGRIWSPRNALVVVPLAVSLMLLMGAGLAVRTVQRMYADGPTFDGSHLIAMSLRLNLQGYDEARRRELQEGLQDRMKGMPGITSVALAASMPISNMMGWFPLQRQGAAAEVGDGAPHADYNLVSASFFDTLGIPLIGGRNFNSADRQASPPVAIVNRELARRYWPNDESIGKRIRFANAGPTLFEIVGVAPDFEDSSSRFSNVRPVVYVPFSQGKLLLQGIGTQVPADQAQFLIRTSGPATKIKGTLRQAAHSLDSSLLVEIQTLDEIRNSQIVPIKTISLALTVLGTLALLMASVGIYAILAYAVSQRTREIGIRMALGAQRREVLSLVMRRMVSLIGSGIGLGLLGTLALERLMSSAIADIGGFDAATYGFPALLLAGIAVLASYLPARKALKVDPIRALRWE